MKRDGSMTSDDSLLEGAKSDKDARKAVQNQIADIKISSRALILMN